MIDFALELADAARAMVADAALPDPKTKPDRSFVTATDLAVEDQLRRMITDRFPDHGILGKRVRMRRRGRIMSGCWTQLTARPPLSRACPCMAR